MDPAFWHTRWQSGQTGWHQERVNEKLQRFWSDLKLVGDETVFVPLCGRSRDMIWLAEQGHPIVGVELNEHAVRQFFSELGLEPNISKISAFQCYQAGPYTIYCGDLFEINTELLAEISAVYDRASLIALPPEKRQAYVNLLTNHLPASCRQLLITIEYDQSRMAGPPFSVREAEVRQHYANGWQIKHVFAEDALAQAPKFQDAGLTSLVEHAYLLRRGG